MRVDVVTIFPEYLAPLDLSLVGKARSAGLLELTVHDLRRWTHDRHHTVDDTPYGGGAGMVMKPEPWGEALDEIVAEGGPVLVVPTPSGEPFTQRVAEELAAEPWLVLACGRYEGIDQRVVDHAATRMRVREVSIGDYVLNGGEVAALAVVEAVSRLLPGFMGNPDSLAEESHGPGRLLEYPVYTKPASWRGLEVPSVLLSGDHGRIAAWRRARAVERTVVRRPDLLPPSAAVDADSWPDAGEGAPPLVLRAANPADAAEVLVLQRACWLAEAIANDTFDIPPLHESLDEVAASFEGWTTLVLHAGPRLVGGVRMRLAGDVWEIGRLMVAPDLQGRGLGRRLLETAEASAPEGAASYALFTGGGSADNLRMYRRAGYRPVAREGGKPDVTYLAKRRRR